MAAAALTTASMPSCSRSDTVLSSTLTSLTPGSWRSCALHRCGERHGHSLAALSRGAIRVSSAASLPPARWPLGRTLSHFGEMCERGTRFALRPGLPQHLQKGVLHQGIHARGGLVEDQQGGLVEESLPPSRPSAGCPDSSGPWVGRVQTQTSGQLRRDPQVGEAA